MQSPLSTLENTKPEDDWSIIGIDNDRPLQPLSFESEPEPKPEPEPSNGPNSEAKKRRRPRKNFKSPKQNGQPQQIRQQAKEQKQPAGVSGPPQKPAGRPQHAQPKQPKPQMPKQQKQPAGGSGSPQKPAGRPQQAQPKQQKRPHPDSLTHADIVNTLRGEQAILVSFIIPNDKYRVESRSMLASMKPGSYFIVKWGNKLYVLSACTHYISPHGCRNGASCKYYHVCPFAYMPGGCRTAKAHLEDPANNKPCPYSMICFHSRGKCNNRGRCAGHSNITNHPQW